MYWLWSFLIGIAIVAVVWTVKTSLQTFVDERVRDVEHTVGRQNGNGTVVEMNEKQLGMLAEMLAWQRDHERADNARFKELDERLPRRRTRRAE